MRKVGISLLIIGAIALISFFAVLFVQFSTFLESRDELLPVLFLLSLSCISVGLCFTYLNAQPSKRKRAILWLSVISGFIFSFGILSKFLSAPGAGIEIVVGLVFFALTVLPLIIKGRYEARKGLMKTRTELLSIADFTAFSLLIFGLLLKILHWPGALVMLIVGGTGLLISLFNWNRSFRKEVKLRAETELKLQEAFSQLESQHLQITEKNKEILDSITYAERIQKTILPGSILLQDELKDYFVWYQPRDIVSGDFYWATKTENRFYLTIADSTGHGVPGAFMSLLNSNFLNEAITEKRIFSTDAILNYIRERLIAALTIEGSSESAQDGMDCVLLMFDRSNSVVEFSGANNSLILFRNGVMQEFEGDRMPVGRSLKTDSFKATKIHLQKGDVLYAFTDGYSDQFGGPSGKKFKRKQLLELLSSIHSLPMKEQNVLLSEKFHSWKGELEQLDDILIAGIRI
ncbi:MAG: hypothetical protein RL007_960 [Bacteroidota bacterium]|jgi:serine phosphatase RsbU (regulator of sigma subunit)